MLRRILFEHLLLVCVLLQHITKAAEERVACIEEEKTEHCLYSGTKTYTKAKTFCSSFNQSLVFYSSSILESDSDKIPKDCFKGIFFKFYGSKNYYKLKLHVKECKRESNNHEVTLGNETFLCSPYCFICRQDKGVIDLTKITEKNLHYTVYSGNKLTMERMDNICTEGEHLVLSGNSFTGVVNGSFLGDGNNGSHWISVSLANCSSVNNCYWKFKGEQEKNTFTFNTAVILVCEDSEVKKPTNTVPTNLSQTDFTLRETTEENTYIKPISLSLHSKTSASSMTSTISTSSPSSNNTTESYPITTMTSSLLSKTLSTTSSTALTNTSKSSTILMSPTTFFTTFKSTPKSSATSKMSSTVLTSTSESSTISAKSPTLLTRPSKSSSTLISPIGSSTILTSMPKSSTASTMMSTISPSMPKSSTASTMMSTISPSMPKASTTSTMMSTISPSMPKSSTTSTMLSTISPSMPKASTTSTMMSTISTSMPTSSTTSTMLSTISTSTLEPSASTLTLTASDTTPKPYTTHPTSTVPSTQLATSSKTHLSSMPTSTREAVTVDITNSANKTTTSKHVNVTDTPIGKTTTSTTTTTTKKPRTCPETERRDLKWRETSPGKCRHIACPEGTTGNATWCCDSKTGEWVRDGPDLSDCKSTALKDILDKFEKNGIQDTLDELRDFVKNETKGQEGDILTVTDFLNKVTNFFEKESANLTQEEKKEKAINITNVVVDTCSEIIDKEMSWQEVPQVVLEVAKILREDYVNKTLRLPLNDLMSATFSHSASVVLPQGFVNTLEEGEEIPLVYTQYSGVDKVFGETCSESSCKLPRNISSKTRLNTPVVGTNLNNDGRNLTFSDGVNITLQHLNSPSKKPSCVFWSLNREGYWDVSGCDVVLHNETHTTCRCNHLTNFAVIMDVHDIFGNIKLPKALQIISIIGCSCSILSLVVCLIVFSVFSRWFGMAPHYLELGTDKCPLTRGRRICVLVGAKDVCVPSIIVCVSLGTRYSDYTSTKYCWLTSENGLTWSFAGPAAFIISVNLVVLVLTLRSASRLGISRKGTTKLIEIRNLVRRTLILVPLFGITWVIGYMQFETEGIIISYIFTISNSLQGLWICLFHLVMKKECRLVVSKSVMNNTISLGQCFTHTKRGGMRRATTTELSLTHPV
ncbi:adhesion G protein-coupled receptor L3-like [Limulus polyphemus]|uniref:Adhesion G protein-coupled receptor L3-like n=1 Tax=Limulus polyphemus TaxID=6850 RepID=A0ABM1S8E3_LIMPO|nr:adhesion G protein-coupled receptor L3-like [Limulus polyphemus]